MGRQPFYTRYIKGADFGKAKALYAMRDLHAGFLAYLESLDSEEGKKVGNEKTIRDKRQTLAEIDAALQKMGLPSEPSDLLDEYFTTERALQALSTGQEVAFWIKQNFPSRYRGKLHLLESSTKALNPELTARWTGIWRSDVGAIGGEAAMATCHIENTLLGSGALTNSVFSRAYLEGHVESGEAELQLFSDVVPLVCHVTASIGRTENTMTMTGRYDIGSFDKGRFEMRRSPDPTQTTSRQGPTRVLAILSNPRDSDHLRLGTEDRVLRECIRLATNRDSIQLNIKHAAQVHDVRRALLEDPYDIIHFSGHGTDEGLILENEMGEARAVPPAALADLLTAYSPPIRCVLFNACYTLDQAELMRGKVPYIIATDQAISDDGAIEFTRGFYDAIGAGKGMKFAFEEGVRTIALLGIHDERVPALIAL